MVVKHRPGGDGIVAGNDIYRAKPDGRTIGATGWGWAFYVPLLTEKPGVEWDLSKFGYIGAQNIADYFLAVSPENPAKSMEDLQQMHGLKFGAGAAEGTGGTGGAILIDVFGLDAKIIAGIHGGEQTLAAAKGEVDGYVREAGDILEIVKQGFIKPPIIFMGFGKSPWFPEVPSLSDVIELSAAQEDMLRVFNTLVDEEVFIVPPGFPQDRLEFMRDAFDQIVALEGYQEGGSSLFFVRLRLPGAPLPRME